jgi:hypothetical protein
MILSQFPKTKTEKFNTTSSWKNPLIPSIQFINYCNNVGVSPLALSNKPIAAETICSLLEAARWTASCYNEQPWHFIVPIQENPTQFNQLLSCLVEANQVWAKHAPVLMIAVAKLNFENEKNGNPNCHAIYDVGAAVCSLTIQVTSLGLFVHQIGGFEGLPRRENYTIFQRGMSQ